MRGRGWLDKLLTYGICAGACLYIGACSSDNEPEANNAVEAHAAALRWEPCAPLIRNGLEGECARTDVPLRWDEPAGRHMKVFVKRYRATSS